MDIFSKINHTRQVLQAIATRKRFPFVVCWNITYRCNLRCKYCWAYKNEVEELNTQEVLQVIDRLVGLGMKFLELAGGEPMLRDDVKEVIDFCKFKKVHIGINTNGTLVAEKFSDIKEADAIQISLDGPRDVHDAIRSKGVHDQVLEGIRLCSKANMESSISAVISSISIHHLDYVLDVARENRIGVFFQPADESLCLRNDREVTIRPETEQYREAIDYLIDKKKRGEKWIFNSVSGLRHLRCWPDAQNISCLSSLMYANMEPDGSFYICDRYVKYRELLAPFDDNLKETFARQELPFPCTRCWSGPSVEMNLLGSFNIGAMLGMWKRFAGSSR